MGKVGMGGVVGRTGTLTGINGTGRQHGIYVFEPSILYALYMHLSVVLSELKRGAEGILLCSLATS